MGAQRTIETIQFNVPVCFHQKFEIKARQKAQHIPEAQQRSQQIGAIPFPMTLIPREKEVQMLYARGKSPDMIAIRLNMKVSKILALLSLIPKAVG